MVWSALRTGSNTDAFLGGYESGAGSSGQPLLERAASDEENLTSAGLDGQAPAAQTGESACLPARLPARPPTRV